MATTKEKKQKGILVLLFGVGLTYFLTRNKTEYNDLNQSAGTLPRGLRNNNPGNIKINSSNNWLGKVPASQNTDLVFEQFNEMKYGIRALLKILKNYYINYNLTSIEEILHRFAPGSKKNTSQYIPFVSNRLNMAPDTLITYDPANFYKLAEAITYFENGQKATTISQLQAVNNEFNIF